MSGHEGDVPLTGGRMTSGVLRRGGTVRRPRAPWSAAVHELLRHLEAVGFDAAPRVIGVEPATEVLTFIDWDSAQPTEPIIELASAAWSFIPLGANEPPTDRPRRLRLLVDAYGPNDRTAILTALKDCKLVSVEQVRHWHLGPADSAAALEYRAAELRRLDSVIDDLAAAL